MCALHVNDSIVVKYGVGIVVHEILTLNTIYIKECQSSSNLCATI